jgi:hypothetical protein
METAAALGLAAAGIAGANEWIQDGLSPTQFPWKIGVAGGLLALFLEGASKVSPELATGLAAIMLVTVIVTPMGTGKQSPISQLSTIATGLK